MFTEQTIIDLAEGIDHVFITEFPTVQQYSDWIEAAVKADITKMDNIARQLIKNERGELLLKEPDDIIPIDIYEHILYNITQYFLKSKTKKSIPSSQAEESN
jgi:hypothetical protein